RRSSDLRRLGVLGTFVWDTIWHPGSGGRPVEQWGGIAYSLAAMTAACPPGWQVEPLAKIGSDLADEVDHFLDSLDCLGSRRGIRVTSRENNRVELRYLDTAERTERLSGGVDGWTAEELLPVVAGLDALYLNFISGFELDFEAATRLRRETAIPLYADLHSLFLGPPGSGPRQPQPLARWQEWFQSFDVVQLNEHEFSLLGYRADQLPDLLEQLTGPHPAIILVTRGSEPAVTATRSSWTAPGAIDEAVLEPNRIFEVRPPPAPPEADPTGCGDVWGATVL